MRTPASSWRCPFLRRPADEFHHLSGRGSDSRYLDGALVLPLSLPAHTAEHVGWSSTDLNATEALDEDTVRLRRTGHFLVRLGEHHAIGVVVLPAETVRQLGLLLHRMAERREVR